MMFLARKTLDHLSQDPEIQRRADERADALKLYRIDLLSVQLEAEARGEAKGEAKGRVELLLKLLGLRFGRLSESTRSRIGAASIEQLDRWAERVLTAPTLDALLKP